MVPMVCFGLCMCLRGYRFSFQVCPMIYIYICNWWKEIVHSWISHYFPKLHDNKNIFWHNSNDFSGLANMPGRYRSTGERIDDAQTMFAISVVSVSTPGIKERNRSLSHGRHHVCKEDLWDVLPHFSMRGWLRCCRRRWSIASQTC